MMNARDNPVQGPLLSKDIEGPERKASWNYRSAVGMFSYFQNSSRPDIEIAVYQCARFCACSKLCYERVIMRIGRYLLRTNDKGIVYHPNPIKGLECYVDADFAGG